MVVATLSEAASYVHHLAGCITSRPEQCWQDIHLCWSPKDTCHCAWSSPLVWWVTSLRRLAFAQHVSVIMLQLLHFLSVKHRCFCAAVSGWEAIVTMVPFGIGERCAKPPLFAQ